MDIIYSFVAGGLIGFVAGLLVMRKHYGRVKSVETAITGK